MKRKVLLVEDNEQNIYLAAFLLEKGGYDVVQARRPSEALRLARETRFDLVLLDIELPETDGYALAGQLRRLADMTDVPMIAVTSYAMVGDREKAIAAGCTDYIEKPIDPETFVVQVARHLSVEKDDESCLES